MRSFALWACAAVSITACGSNSDPSDPQLGHPGGASAGAGSPAATAGNTSGGNTSGGSAAGGSSGGAGDSAGQTSAGNGAVAGSTAGGGAGGTGGASPCGTDAPSQPPPITQCPAGGSTPPEQALAAVNELRAHMGLACMTLVPEISTASQKHCEYYQQNKADKTCIANAHEEVETCPGFVAKSFATRMTEAGYQGSPRSEVMAFSGEPASAIAQWVNSVYHRTPLLSPWIREMGYGATADCDTVDMGAGPKSPDDQTALYPWPGQVDVPLSFDGSREGPMPPKPPTGWPSASPIHVYVKGYTATTHDVFVDGSCDPLPHQWLPEKEQLMLYPDAPFKKATKYRVVITGTRGGKSLSFDWTFTTKN
jgi:uncharacterized protein YkwD